MGSINVYVLPHRLITIPSAINETIKEVGLKANLAPLTDTKPSFSPKHTPQTNYSILGPSPSQDNTTPPPTLSHTMTNRGFEASPDDDLSQLFASFNPLEQGASSSIAVPTEELVTRDWTCTAMARVLTERPVMESHFTPLMMRVWEVQASTKLSLLERNTFLVEFASKADMEEVLHREPWTYRNDIVSVTRVCDQEDVSSSSTKRFELWTQMHNIPPELMTDKGARYLATRLGLRVSEVQAANINGKPFYRAKVAYEVGAPLQDVLKIHHEFLGERVIHLLYEKALRICLFCGHLGHDLGHCKDYGKVMRMESDPAYQNRPELDVLKERRLGAWINDFSAVPKAEVTTGPHRTRFVRREQTTPMGNGSDQQPPTGPATATKRASLSGSKGQRASSHPLDDALVIHENGDTSPNSPNSKRFRAASPTSPPRFL